MTQTITRRVTKVALLFARAALAACAAGAVAPGFAASMMDSEVTRFGPQPTGSSGQALQGGRIVQVSEGKAPPIAADAAASIGSAPTRLVIHHHEGDAAAKARARELKAQFAAPGKLDVQLRPVTASVAADNLRIFFESDRRFAEHTIKPLLSGPISIRDFRHYRPLPRAGTIELWLAATASAVKRPAAPTKSSAGTTGDAPTSSGLGAEDPSAPAPTKEFDSQIRRLLLLQQGN